MIRWLICLTLVYLTSGSMSQALDGVRLPNVLHAPVPAPATQQSAPPPASEAAPSQEAEREPERARERPKPRERETPKRSSTPVNINTANVQELDGLPGIGEHMAQRIIEYRQKNGPFKRLEDLMGVRGIGEKNFLKLKPLITITPPAKGDRSGS
jgi:comEA protein